MEGEKDLFRILFVVTTPSYKPVLISAIGLRCEKIGLRCETCGKKEAQQRWRPLGL
jgi:hypothetical protein